MAVINSGPTTTNRMIVVTRSQCSLPRRAEPRVGSCSGIVPGEALGTV